MNILRKLLLQGSVLLGLLLLAGFGFTLQVQADVAPPQQPPGTNPTPEAEITQVRMISETVHITVLPEAPADSLAQAQVHALFQMRNLGTEPESLQVRFLLSINDGFGNYLKIQDLSVRVDGEPVPTREIGDPSDGEDSQIRWASFPVDFPPGADVFIEVAYILEGTGEYPYVSFRYLLETGIDWKDTIGEANLIVQLPYEVNRQNVIIHAYLGWDGTTPGAMLDGNELRWHYEDLEPGPYDILRVAMVMPAVWMKVLKERENVAANPEDGEAWGRLGKIYKEISLFPNGVRRDPGGKELYALSARAYERALELLPENALWHAGFADLLFRRYYWEEYAAGEPPVQLMRAIREFHTAYTLDPHHPLIHQMLDDVHSSLGAVDKQGEAFVFLWLTATPTPLPPTRTSTATIPPTPMKTSTPAPTAPPPPTEHPATPQPLATPSGAASTLEQTAEPTGGTPFCVGALLLPLVGLAALIPGISRRLH